MERERYEYGFDAFRYIDRGFPIYWACNTTYIDLMRAFLLFRRFVVGFFYIYLAVE